MKDKLGLYYYPVLENKNLRMYVRTDFKEVEFRLWDAEDPSLWDEHGWFSWTAIQEAAALYEKERKSRKPPLHLYDLNVALRLLRDEIEEKFSN